LNEYIVDTLEAKPQNVYESWENSEHNQVTQVSAITGIAVSTIKDQEEHPITKQ
jgi:hypothetical protein